MTVIVIGGTYNLHRDGLPQTDRSYAEHADHPLTVVRELRADECDREEVGQMYEVSAPDGWRGSVFADELMPVRCKAHDGETLAPAACGAGYQSLLCHLPAGHAGNHEADDEASGVSVSWRVWREATASLGGVRA